MAFISLSVSFLKFITYVVYIKLYFCNKLNFLSIDVQSGAHEFSKFLTTK
jgi:hypothetical protein